MKKRNKVFFLGFCFITVLIASMLAGCSFSPKKLADSECSEFPRKNHWRVTIKEKVFVKECVED